MANLSQADQVNLSAEQQAKIKEYKDAWAAANAAGDQAGMDAAHQAAEAIRAQASGGGYSGGSDGSGQVLLSDNGTAAPNTTTAANIPQGAGATADDVAQWVKDYEYSNYDVNKGWINGYSTAMNVRSMANYIRQQMQANSNAWASADAEGKAYLHEQNQQLAKILEEASGGAKSTYNEQLGRWETTNSNLGYGYDVGQYNDLDWYKNFYGMTDDQIEQYRNDTDRYRNYVDTRTIRNWIDDSSGYTGLYAQFVNGPYAQLLTGTKGVNPSVYMDLIGDGEGWEDYVKPGVDENGVVIPQAPYLKNNNAMTDYTRQFASYVDENGIIQPGQLVQNNPGRFVRGESVPSDSHSTMNTGSGSSGSGSSSADSGSSSGSLSGTLSSLFPSMGSTSSLEEYLQMMYDANLQSQLAALESAYQSNLSTLDTTGQKTDSAYDEQKRQAAGEAARQAANWREVANAQGLNSGAFGQAALAQNNQLQSNLNTLGSAQAQAQAELEQQRALLGQQYQLAILEAQSENDFERASALYQEAVRQDEALRQEQQFYASLAADMFSTLVGVASSSAGSSSKSSSSSGSGSSGGGQYITPVVDDDPDEEELVSSLSGLNNVGIYNDVILADPTKSTEQKNNLAWEYYDRGYITWSQLQGILNQLGTGA